MPHSTHYAIPRVLWLAETLKPRTVLDVGCGSGKYGVLFRFTLEQVLPPQERAKLRIDGLDAVRPEIPSWQRVYDRIYVGDVCTLLPELDTYDLIYFGDIIEHFEKPDGYEVVRSLLLKARMGVVVTTPYHFFEQGAINGNEFERHRSLWTRKDFRSFGNARCWVEFRRKLVALVSNDPIPPLPGDRFSRSWLSSSLEHLVFKILSLSAARRLKRKMTGIRAQ